VLDPEVIEGTATDLVPTEPEPHNALFRTDDPVQVVEEATRVADSLAKVIQAKQLFNNIQGKAHVRVEGWQLLGVMLGVTAVCTSTEPVEGGYKATVEARTADGRVVGRADALCTKHEKRGPWKSADDYARLSMAQTRATSKALKGPLGFVVSLAGYEATPAEEMTFAEPDAPSEERTLPTPPSDKQLDFLTSLAKQHGADGNEQELVRAYAKENLTGGKEGSCSKTIEALKGVDPEAGEFLVKLLKAAEKWAAAQSDVPPDTEGLAMPEAA
jgi:hypothetical protein